MITIKIQVCFLVLLLLGFTGIVRGQGCKQVTFLPCEKDKRLAGHVFDQIDMRVDDAQENCQDLCYLEEKCISYNLGQSEGDNRVCELSDTDHVEHPDDVISQVGAQYCAMKNPCASNPCQGNITCVPNFHLNIFKCIVACNTSSAFGVEDGRIPDQQLTASSVYDNDHLPVHGRLKANKEGWTPKTKDLNQWFQVDLGSVAKVTGIATQGAPFHDEWVTSYGLQYSVDNSTYEEGEKSFSGNSDRNTVVKNDVNPAITARYIRVRPKTYKKHMTMRVELYGCN